MEHAISPDPPFQGGSAMHGASSQPIHNGDKATETDEKKATLEEMFDEDSDEEFPSSAPAVKAEEPPAELVEPPQASYSDPEVMRVFYLRLFPFRYLFQWLNHSTTPTDDFGHREFAFTMQDDGYRRYQSWATADLMRKQCVTQIPKRFEIGPVYSANPRDRKSLRTSAFRPISKELVFDIDMTDYDEIRTCCTGAKICHSCWAFITMAIQVVDVALRDDFGFKHILWVYSGRRGAHAWVCDKRAREMDDQKRRAVAGYLELIKGGDKGGKKVNVKRPLHPHLQRSLAILRSHFETTILQSQDPWSDPSKFPHLLALLPDANLVSALREKWELAPTLNSASKWADIDTIASSGVSNTLNPKDLLSAKQDIILEYTYPRLDAEVSKKLNHLLKSPFCVHPGTGRVCVPIDVRRVEEFDPWAVPTVTELLGEIDEWDRRNNVKMEVDGGEGDSQGVGREVKRIPDWEKTRLKGYVDYFRGFVTSLLREERAVGVKREREEGDPMEF